jgi:hypothetical protein
MDMDGLDREENADGDNDTEDTSFERQTNGPTPSEERELRFVAEEDEDTSRINSIGLSRHHSTGDQGGGAQDGINMVKGESGGFRKSARWGEEGMRGLLWRHRVVYFSIAWVFVVTLVSLGPSRPPDRKFVRLAILMQGRLRMVMIISGGLSTDHNDNLVGPWTAYQVLGALRVSPLAFPCVQWWVPKLIHSAILLQSFLIAPNPP